MRLVLGRVGVVGGGVSAVAVGAGGGGGGDRAVVCVVKVWSWRGMAVSYGCGVQSGRFGVQGCGRIVVAYVEVAAALRGV